MSIFDSSPVVPLTQEKAPGLNGQDVSPVVAQAAKTTPAPQLHVQTAKDTAMAMNILAPYLSPDSVMVGDGQTRRGERRLSPAIGLTEPESEDYEVVRWRREAGCTRPCAYYDPSLPLCTACFANLHAGRWKPGERLVFGYGDNWEEVLGQMSQVHGWIKPKGM